MATSPAPDAAAPPGMCPGVAVLGGGGDGGGGSGDGTGDGSGNSGAGTGRGENASGDQRRAASGSGCGGSSGCPGPHASNGGSASRGDPVDVVTGRVFTVPALDLFLPGPLPLTLTRAYSSGARNRNVGLGFGWSHSLAWTIDVGRRSILLWKGDGTAVEFPRIDAGEEVIGRGGWLLRHSTSGFVLDTTDGLFRHFSSLTPGAKGHCLTAVVDKNGNRIELIYDDHRLVEIVDSVGRRVRVRQTADGRIASITVQNAASQGRWMPFATFVYDEHGDLVAATDADGHTIRYAYTDHLLTSYTDPTGLTVHFVYDGKDRCIETWGDYPGRPDLSLATSLPMLLADQTTRARGFLHCKFEYDGRGYSEVVDSVKVQRFFGNDLGMLDKAVSGGAVFTRVFDTNGHLISFTDPMMATTIWERDPRGRVLKETDPLGRTVILHRDGEGRVVEVTDPAGFSTAAAYDPKGNVEIVIDPLGGVASFRCDARGLLVEATLPNGGTTRLSRDGHGNVIAIVEPNGAAQHATYDWFGRMTSLTDPTGTVVRYAYSNRGDLLARFSPTGEARYEYDGARQLTRATDMDGRVYELVWGGPHVLCRIRKPNGDVIDLHYDREGQVIAVHNEQGEQHTFARDLEGRIVEQRTFDGRTLRYRYDLAGRVTLEENTASEKTIYTYDLAGQLIERLYADDTVDTFEYSPRGELTRITSHSGVFEFEHDPAGQLVREVQTVDGTSHWVETDFDAAGRRVRRRTSLGHLEEVERDAAGKRTRVVLDGDTQVIIINDSMGREIRRRLPDGGEIESTFDAIGQLARRRVVQATAQPGAQPDEPRRIGVGAQRSSVDVAYRYSPAGELLEVWDQVRRITRYQYDPLGQVLAVLPEQAVGELFRYDATGNVFESGEGAVPRVYGTGGRLLRRGKTEYLWDFEGRLIEKIIRETDGSPRERWKYSWGADGLLRSVRRHDGTLVEFSYDPFARRLIKRSTKTSPAGGPATLVSTTRYVWNGDLIAHEIRKSTRTSGDPVIEEKTFCFEDEGLHPFAHRDARAEGDKRVKSPWYHYVNDPVGSPSRLVEASGKVVSEVYLSAFGRSAPARAVETTSPLRFQGQYDDPETGLHYNRHRYFDPEVARYISADPIGLLGGLNAYRYAVNRPTWFVDPSGLVNVIRCAVQGGVTGHGVSGAHNEGHVTSDVTNALPPPGMGGRRDEHDHRVGHCAEPRALSEYIERERKRPPPGRSTQEIIAGIPPNGIRTTRTSTGRIEPPCRYCEHMFAELGVQPSQVQGFQGSRFRRIDEP